MKTFRFVSFVVILLVLVSAQIFVVYRWCKNEGFSIPAEKYFSISGDIEEMTQGLKGQLESICKNVALVSNIHILRETNKLTSEEVEVVRSRNPEEKDLTVFLDSTNQLSSIIVSSATGLLYTSVHYPPVQDNVSKDGEWLMIESDKKRIQSKTKSIFFSAKLRFQASRKEYESYKRSGLKFSFDDFQLLKSYAGVAFIVSRFFQYHLVFCTRDHSIDRVHFAPYERTAWPLVYENYYEENKSPDVLSMKIRYYGYYSAFLIPGTVLFIFSFQRFRKGTFVYPLIQAEFQRYNVRAHWWQFVKIYVLHSWDFLVTRIFSQEMIHNLIGPYCKRFSEQVEREGIIEFARDIQRIIEQDPKKYASQIDKFQIFLTEIFDPKTSLSVLRTNILALRGRISNGTGVVGLRGTTYIGIPSTGKKGRSSFVGSQKKKNGDNGNRKYDTPSKFETRLFSERKEDAVVSDRKFSSELLPVFILGIGKTIKSPSQKMIKAVLEKYNCSVDKVYFFDASNRGSLRSAILGNCGLIIILTKIMGHKISEKVVVDLGNAGRSTPIMYISSIGSKQFEAEFVRQLNKI